MARTMRKLGRTRVDGGLLKVAVRRLSEGTDVVFTYDDVLERLDEPEQLSLIAIYGRLSTPLSPGAAFVPLGSPEDRANAREYAKWLREQPEDARGTRRKLAEFTERIERVPSDAELLVYNGAGAKDTHESLAPKLKELNAGVFTLADGRPREVLNKGALEPGDEARLQSLIEKAADDPGLFQRRFEEAQMQAKIAELHERLRPKPKAKPRLDEPGSTWQPQAVFEHLSLKGGPALDIPCLGVKVFLQSQLMNGKSLTPNGKFEGEPGKASARLTITRAGLGVKFDPDGCFVGWPKMVDHLAQNGWLVVERDNIKTKVGLGPRLLREATA